MHAMPFEIQVTDWWLMHQSCKWDPILPHKQVIWGLCILITLNIVHTNSLNMLVAVWAVVGSSIDAFLMLPCLFVACLPACLPAWLLLSTSHLHGVSCQLSACLHGFSCQLPTCMVFPVNCLPA